MIARDQRAVLLSLVHECQLLLHVRSWEERYVFQPQRLEDVLVAVIVERKTRETLKRKTRKVNVHTILPAFARLKGQRLENIFDVA
jgi:hypothetical protein